VRLLDAASDLDEVRGGEVLVARAATPRLAAAVTRASAVITDVGSAAGHLAAVAREFRVPMVVDTEVATQVLADAGEVTVDAEENVVYAGRVEPLLHYQLVRSSSFEDSPEFRLLRTVLRRIAPLNLKDPQSADFSAARCVTYHDVIRFAHEEAVRTLAEGFSVRVSASNPYVRRLQLEIPLGLTVVDLGGGLAEPAAGRAWVAPSDIESAPLGAVLDGLLTEGVWATGPADMDLDGFMSSATRSLPPGAGLAARPQQNLALVSSQYLHLSLRLGYHFNVVDSFLTERRDDNFIYFRFAGGVTEIARRSRRARLLKEILESLDFVVEGKGDLVIGRVRNLTPEGMRERLTMVGKLIGFSRQLDILLRSDSLVDQYARRFLEGRYEQIEA
jgi:pyruvate,water dikinase